MNSNWKAIKSIYRKKLNISSDMVYLMSDYDIIKLCAVGLSNTTISRVLNISQNDIRKSIQKYLLFSGYKNDLDINPYEIYLRISLKDYGKEAFFDEVLILSMLLRKKDLDKIYNVCRRFKDLEERIEKEWK